MPQVTASQWAYYLRLRAVGIPPARAWPWAQHTQPTTSASPQPSLVTQAAAQAQRWHAGHVRACAVAGCAPVVTARHAWYAAYTRARAAVRAFRHQAG